MSRKGNQTEQETGLRRSARTRTKQRGEVLDNGWGYSSDSEVLRDQRERWSIEAVLGLPEGSDYLDSENRMSRKEGDPKDSDNPGSLRLLR